MNIEALASAVIAIMAPFLPFLVNISKEGGKKLIEVIQEKGGDAAWELAQKLWGKLKPHADENAEVKGATLLVTANPEDESRQALLAVVLTKQLMENPNLARELIDILGGPKSIQQVIANHKSSVTDVSQLSNGVGDQIAKADNNSRIKGVRQIQK